MGFVESIISKLFKSEEDRKRLHKVVIPSLVIHFFAGILSLVLIFVFTRCLGSIEYGVYTYSMSIVFILVNIATYGICLMIVKEAPSLLSTGKLSLLKGLHNWSRKLVFLICVAFAIIAAIFITIATFYWHIMKEGEYTIPLLLSFLTIPVFGVMNYYSAALRGNFKVLLSLMPDNIIKPLGYLIAVGVLFIFSIHLNIYNAILLNVLSFGGAALYAIIKYNRTSPDKNITAEYENALWKITLKSFFLLTLVTSLNSKMDILMLRYLKNSSAVGIYNAADMIATKLMIFLVILNQVSAPYISRLHTLEHRQELQDMITKISRWVMVISLPAFAVIVVFSRWIMSSFGADFAGGQNALIIISIGQIINIAFGPVGNFALMTGNQRFNIIFTAIIIVINIVLNIILTPTLGINGTAIATACSLVIWNFGMFVTIWKKTGIRTWIFG